MGVAAEIEAEMPQIVRAVGRLALRAQHQGADQLRQLRALDAADQPAQVLGLEASP
jgi:hypothetical protein